MVPFSVTSWYSCARTLGEIRPGSNVARFRPRSLGSLAAGLAGSRGRTRFVIWFTTRFMTRFTTWDTYPVRLWTLITRQRYGVMPAGVCAVTLSLLKRAWTTSARPELAEGRVHLDGSTPWLPHLCSILVSPGASVGLGISVGFGRGPTASFTSFVPSSLPFFPPATKSQFNKYRYRVHSTERKYRVRVQYGYQVRYTSVPG